MLPCYKGTTQDPGRSKETTQHPTVNKLNSISAKATSRPPCHDILGAGLPPQLKLRFRPGQLLGGHQNCRLLEMPCESFPEPTLHCHHGECLCALALARPLLTCLLFLHPLLHSARRPEGGRRHGVPLDPGADCQQLWWQKDFQSCLT